MKTLRLLAVCMILASISGLRAEAIPAFARAYHMSCASCHAYYPRLNDFGEQFRRNGYQLPGKSGLVTIASQRTLPASVEINTSSERSGSDNGNATTGYVLSGGTLAKDISFFFRYPAHTDTNISGAVPPERLQRADLLFSNVANTGLNVRGGRFTPAYYAFQPSYHLLFGENNWEMPSTNDYAEGVEISRYGAGCVSYYLGEVRWVQGYTYSALPHGYYGRVAKSFAGGLGETKGHWIGLSAFSGQVASFTYGPWYQNYPHMADQPLKQISADTSLNFGRANLSALYALGKYSSNESHPSQDFSAYVAQLAYAISPRWAAAFQVESVTYKRDAWANFGPTAPYGTDRYVLGVECYPAASVGLSVQYIMDRIRGLAFAGDTDLVVITGKLSY